MRALKWTLSIFFVFILSHLYAGQVYGATQIDGDIVVSTLTVTGPVLMSSLTATGNFTAQNVVISSAATISSVQVSTLAVISSATIHNLTAYNVTLSSVNILGPVSGTVLGKIKQIAFGTTSSAAGTTSSSFQSTNLAVSFTNLNAGCTIYVLVSGDVQTAATVNEFVSIFRDSVNLASSLDGLSSFLSQAPNTNRSPIAMIAKDVLNAINTYSYSVKIRNGDGSTLVKFPSDNIPDANMIIIEVY